MLWCHWSVALIVLLVDSTSAIELCDVTALSSFWGTNYMYNKKKRLRCPFTIIYILWWFQLLLQTLGHFVTFSHYDVVIFSNSPSHVQQCSTIYLISTITFSKFDYLLYHMNIRYFVNIRLLIMNIAIVSTSN